MSTDIENPSTDSRAIGPSAPSPRPVPPVRHSVRGRLMGIVLTAAVLLVIVGFAGLHGVSSVNLARGDDLRVTDVQVALARVDADRDGIGGAVLEHVLAADPKTHLDPADSRAEFGAAADALRKDFAAAAARGLEGPLQAELWSQWPRLAAYVAAGQSLMAGVTTDPAGAATQLGEFDALSNQSAEATARFQARLDRASMNADERAADAATAARREIEWIGAGAIVLLFGLAWALGRLIVRALRAVGATAGAITSGDLDARTTITGDDEIGALGRALNEMADSLRGLFVRLGDEARRDAFSSQLAEAFEIADTAPDAYRQVEVAMNEISDELPMELLLADSSQGTMEEKAAHPVTGSPGCPVNTPYACVAVRRGSATVFNTSEALNACPKLRGRAGGPCSAACIPVTFMGRALGVLHVTGPDSDPPSPQQVVRLTALAAQSGNTIGTVRSTATTVRHATTDGLTGLINRRTLETEMRALLERGQRFAIAMADLDHFKNINDTYGHQAGDRALRLFSNVVQTHTRSEDIVGRYGGEEFVLLFPGQTANAARQTLERLRAELASAQTDGDNPRFTASYGLSDADRTANIEEILHVADKALAAAKQAGRDCISTAEDAREGPLRIV